MKQQKFLMIFTSFVPTSNIDKKVNLKEIPKIELIFLLGRKVGCRKYVMVESLLFIGAGAAAGVVAGEGKKNRSLS